MLFRSLASSTQTPRPERRLAPQDAEREGRVGAGHDGGREGGAVALPRAQVEGLVAEEDVVGAARPREPGLGLGAGGLSRVGLPVEER